MNRARNVRLRVRRGVASWESVALVAVAALGISAFGALGVAWHRAVAGSSAGGAPAQTLAVSAEAGILSGVAHLEGAADITRHGRQVGSHATEPLTAAERVAEVTRVRELDARLTAPDRELLVVPSLSVDPQTLRGITGLPAYEERVLWALGELRDPDVKLTYVTSQALNPAFVDQLLRRLGDTAFVDSARSRLTLQSTYDTSTLPLAYKLLDRPLMVNRLRESLNLDRALLKTWNVTDAEWRLSQTLGIPLLGSNPRVTDYWGGKSGGRRLFREAGVALPDGVENLYTRHQVADAIAEMWARDPGLEKVVVKHNQGVSGQGNAVLDLRPIADVAPGQPGVVSGMTERALFRALGNMRFAADGVDADQFFAMLERQGGVAEAWVSRAERSPSGQADVLPSGEVRVASTHEQLLDGPDGQVFAGAVFPAASQFRSTVQSAVRRIGERLAEEGFVGRFAVDFMARPRDETRRAWELFAVDPNLREGGTTHPMKWLELASGGSFRPETGAFELADGSKRYYVATDTFIGRELKGYLPEDIERALERAGLAYDRDTASGVLLHMTGALSEDGKVGYTAVGRSRAEATAIFEGLQEAFGGPAGGH